MNLGLAQTEARVYVYLAKKGSHVEKELAKALRISDQNLRRSLNNLQKKGFVTSRTKDQTIYIAVPLEKVIDKIVKVRTEVTRRLEQDKKKFLST